MDNFETLSPAEHSTKREISLFRVNLSGIGINVITAAEKMSCLLFARMVIQKL